MIEATGVTKRYGETIVVDDVSVTLPESGVTSIIGSNGAGKSTLLSMISRLVPLSAGQVVIDGLDVAKARGDEIARRLAILRQENHLAARLTVRDLVAFGRYPHSKGRPTADDLAHVEQAIGYLDIGGLAHRFLDELSGGQRQRAFVAMVLCQDTRFVLLDEPLNSLDMKHAMAMMKLFRRAADELGKTIVLVLHDINFASCYSDRIIGMRDGRVICDGPPKAIVTPETMAEIYGIDTSVAEIRGERIVFYYR